MATPREIFLEKCQRNFRTALPERTAAWRAVDDNALQIVNTSRNLGNALDLLAAAAEGNDRIQEWVTLVRGRSAEANAGNPRESEGEAGFLSGYNAAALDPDPQIQNLAKNISGLLQSVENNTRARPELERAAQNAETRWQRSYWYLDKALSDSEALLQAHPNYGSPDTPAPFDPQTPPPAGTVNGEPTALDDIKRLIAVINEYANEIRSICSNAQRVLDEMALRWESNKKLLAEIVENYHHLVAVWSSEAEAAQDAAQKAESREKVKRAGAMMADGTFALSDWYAPRTDAWYRTIGGLMGMPQSMNEHAQKIVEAIRTGTCSECSSERIYTESGKTIASYQARIKAEKEKLAELLASIQIDRESADFVDGLLKPPPLEVPQFPAYNVG